MRAACALCIALTAPLAVTAQPTGLPREMRFSGPAAVDALCACLLDARRIAEGEGRIDFTAEVESAGDGASSSMTAKERRFGRPKICPAARQASNDWKMETPWWPALKVRKC